MSKSITKHHVRPTGPNTAPKFQWLLLLVVKNLAPKFKNFFSLSVLSKDIENENFNQKWHIS